MATPKYPCPCCGYVTLEEQPPGTFEICPVCFWEDDEVQARDCDYAGGANAISLREARRNFAEYGAISAEFRDKVRAPSEEERRGRANVSPN